MTEVTVTPLERGRILTGRKKPAESEASPMKTKESRFQIHDELTAPERSLPVLKGALAAGGQLSNFIAVLSGSPAALRASPTAPR